MMGGYFSTLLQHYGPSETQFTVMPDSPAPVEEEITAAPVPAPQPADPVAEIPSDSTPMPATTEDANSIQSVPSTELVQPSDFRQPPVTPDIDPPVSSEHIITDITERVIHETARPEIDYSSTPDTPAPVQTHVNETYQTDVYVTETHTHEMPTPPSEGEERTAPEPARQDEEPAEAMRQVNESDALLGALQAHMDKAFASLSNPQKPPPLAIIDEADFEPEDTGFPPQLAPEEAHEITREIVREVHHHHHHETKVVSEKAPALRTAESVSQIGRIRLSSHWGAS